MLLIARSLMGNPPLDVPWEDTTDVYGKIISQYDFISKIKNLRNEHRDPSVSVGKIYECTPIVCRYSEVHRNSKKSTVGVGVLPQTTP